MRRLLFLCMALLTVLPAMGQNNKKKRDEDHSFQLMRNLEIFNTLYGRLDMYYVDSLDTDEMMTLAIDAMLEKLDPYTVYYTEEEQNELSIMTTGKYGGIGSVIRMRKDSVVVIAEPYEHMPAAEVGLKIGDELMRIDKTDLKGLTVDKVSEMLRGDPGTSFDLTVHRPGEQKNRTFHITRRVIQTPSITYYGLLNSQNVAAGVDGSKIGYVYLNQFIENCSKDMKKAVEDLKRQGATSLVIDLRSNGGGLLNEAVQIVGLFVPDDQLVVQTRGKLPEYENTYKTRGNTIDLDIPICVLVDHSTASAAEILAGSLQDMDRAVIIGTQTYGKGLVQSQVELPYHTSMKYTSAKYYIPSGRCIQAIDYKKKRNPDNTKETIVDSLQHKFHTANGRTVYDGHGITPDIEIKHDTLANIVFYLNNDDVLPEWCTKYESTHEIPSLESFEITDEDFEDFKRLVKDRDFKYDRVSLKTLAELKKTAELEGYYDQAKEEFDALEKKLTHNIDMEMDKKKKEIKQIMALQIAKGKFYQQGAVKELIKDDEDLKKASEILNDPQQYKNILEGR